MKVGVIDYKAGNAPSVLNALRHLNIPAVYVSTRAQLESVGMLILPGVGSAAATLRSLEELDLPDALDERVNRAGVPFLGICIGLQILFEHSEEGDTPCLGWLPGQVKRFPADSVRIPQMGWNEVTFTNGGESDYFYFVNSYYVSPADKAVVAAEADYGLRFCAMVRRGHICATQFHLEKSGEAGLKLLGKIVGGAYAD